VAVLLDHAVRVGRPGLAAGAHHIDVSQDEERPRGAVSLEPRHQVAAALLELADLVADAGLSQLGRPQAHRAGLVARRVGGVGSDQIAEQRSRAARGGVEVDTTAALPGRRSDEPGHERAARDQDGESQGS
jgi:hypothetical protein